ncbi:MAG: polysaccharide lyase 8 family protein [Pirellulales bacterium]|nr:polysaccharide lyase 8 family protein [Pirellulales bacterium]
MCSTFRISLCSAFIAITVPLAATEGDLEKVRSQWFAFQTGADADRKDPQVQASLSELHRTAAKLLRTMTPEGKWPDIDYAHSRNPTNCEPAQHYRNLYKMALAWHTPGQASHHNDALMAAVERGLVFAHRNLFSKKKNISPNWWWNEIGINLSLGPTLVLVEGHINPKVLNAQKRTFYSKIYATPKHDGQNRIWSAMNHFYRALLDRDAARMEIVKKDFDRQCVVETQGEGIMPDYSFHQHGSQLYTGGYGRAFATDIGEYLIFTRSTAFSPSPAALDAFAHYIMEGTNWVVFKNRYDLSVRGREITRGDEHRNMLQKGPFLGFLALAERDGWWRKAAIAVSKEMRNQRPDNQFWGGNKMFPYHVVASRIAAVMHSPVPAGAPKGFRHFPYSEHSVRRERDWYASVRMLSSRLKASENVNGENFKGWHLSDGVLWVFLTGDEYVTHNVMPTLDWQRLPGTTVERKPRKPGQGLGKGVKDFVGGVGDGLCGVAAMDFQGNESELTAKKSYFFFDQEIVCLGSDVACPSKNPVETTIDQRPMEDESSDVLVDGKLLPRSASGIETTLDGPAWIEANHVGYYFPRPCKVKLARRFQTGRWTDLTKRDVPKEEFANEILALWIEHGSGPKKGEYCYAVLPNQDAQSMKVYAAKPPIKILQQDDRIHAVEDLSSKAVGVVFWQPGRLGPVEIDRPCVVLYRGDGDRMTVALAEPSWQHPVVRLVVHHPVEVLEKPEGCEVTVKPQRTVIQIPCAHGETCRLTLRKKDAF